MNPRRRCSLVVAALLVAGTARAQEQRAPDPPDVAPAQPVIPDRSFNLKDFGGKGDDGATVNTDAFRQAIAAVAKAGGGTLIVPAAPGAYFTGPIDLCSNLNFHLEAGAKILFSPKFEDYRSGFDPARGGPIYRPLIQVTAAHDVLVSGSGTIDGHGEVWWPLARPFKAAAIARHASSATMPRPSMLWFEACRRIRVEGITLTNSPVYNLIPQSCVDVTVEGITILNPADALNTDGVGPKNCQRVLIAHCRIDTGDDCVVLGSGGSRPDQDILVTDCTFLHGHGCSIGNYTRGGVRNVIIRRCTFDGTDAGVRFKSNRGAGGLVENVVYEDLTMKNVGVAITLSSNYGKLPTEGIVDEKPQAVTAQTPRWRNITIRNVTATGCRRNAGLIAGLAEMPAEAITLEHISIEAPTGLHLANAENIVLRDVHIQAATGPDVIVDPTVIGLTRRD